MDLRTILNKVKGGRYEAIGEVQDDVALMFANCRTYNVPEAPVSEVRRDKIKYIVIITSVTVRRSSRAVYAVTL